IHILQGALRSRDGFVYFEYSIPRMGKRIDVVLIVSAVIFVLEFKIGKEDYSSAALDQVCDYALDLKNFHETSASPLVCPILVATKAGPAAHPISPTPHNDKLLYPIRCNTESLETVIEGILAFAADAPAVNPTEWANGRYRPTPTIIEAALALYRGH